MAKDIGLQFCDTEPETSDSEEDLSDLIATAG